MKQNPDKAKSETSKKDPEREKLKSSEIDWRSFEEKGFELFDLEDDEDGHPS